MKGKLPARYQSVGLGQEGGIEVGIVNLRSFLLIAVFLYCVAHIADGQFATIIL